MPTLTHHDPRPDFLLIGAMKSGTTTFYYDLLSQPGIVFPESKEPHTLVHCEDDDVPADYQRHYQSISGSGLRGEASTGYSKLPTYPGVAEKALRLLGPDVNILYVIRHPIDRLLSHHHHVYTAGECSPDIHRAVSEHPELVQYSCYARQIRPWLDAFGVDKIKIVLFEEYVADRPNALAQVCRFLGTVFEESASLNQAYNTSALKPRSVGWHKNTVLAAAYRVAVRPFLSAGGRRRLVELFVPKASPRDRRLPREVFADIRETLAADQEHLRKITGRTAPLYDLDAFVEPASI